MQGVHGRCRGGAGYLHRLHLSKHNIQCREVQAHLTKSPEAVAKVAGRSVVGAAVVQRRRMMHQYSKRTQPVAIAGQGSMCNSGKTK